MANNYSRGSVATYSGIYPISSYYSNEDSYEPDAYYIVKFIDTLDNNWWQLSIDILTKHILNYCPEYTTDPASVLRFTKLGPKLFTLDYQNMKFTFYSLKEIRNWIIENGEEYLKNKKDEVESDNEENNDDDDDGRTRVVATGWA